MLINFIVMLWKKPLVKKELFTKLDFQQQVILSQKTFEETYFRNLQSYIKITLNKKYNSHLNNDWKLNSLKINNSSLTSIIKNIINFITIYLSLILIFDNKINLSQLIFITSINIYILSFFQNVGNVLIFLPSLNKSLQRVNQFMNIKKSQINKNCISSPTTINKITIENCYFNISNKKLFINLNLTFKQNNIILGPTGIGKTSLLLLIAQKYSDFKWKILINDSTNMQNITFKEWQNVCIYVSSNCTIYSGTILENILSFDITKEKLMHFQKLGFDNILTNLDLTTFYHCQKYGTNLSQGQKQIIVFLSLFFNNWKVILLDEMLSNVNNALKISLIKLLLTYFNKAIIIYADHDLALLKLFENVINLKTNVCIGGENNELHKEK